MIRSLPHHNQETGQILILFQGQFFPDVRTAYVNRCSRDVDQAGDVFRGEVQTEQRTYLKFCSGEGGALGQQLFIESAAHLAEQQFEIGHRVLLRLAMYLRQGLVELLLISFFREPELELSQFFPDGTVKPRKICTLQGMVYQFLLLKLHIELKIFNIFFPE